VLKCHEGVHFKTLSMLFSPDIVRRFLIVMNSTPISDFPIHAKHGQTTISMNKMVSALQEENCMGSTAPSTLVAWVNRFFKTLNLFSQHVGTLKEKGILSDELSPDEVAIFLTDPNRSVTEAFDAFKEMKVSLKVPSKVEGQAEYNDARNVCTIGIIKALVEVDVANREHIKQAGAIKQASDEKELMKRNQAKEVFNRASSQKSAAISKKRARVDFDSDSEDGDTEVGNDNGDDDAEGLIYWFLLRISFHCSHRRRGADRPQRAARRGKGESNNMSTDCCGQVSSNE